MSTAVELALDSVIGRATEPLMLDKPLSVDELPTPALVLDPAKNERQYTNDGPTFGEYGKGFRPHAKTHKCPTIARLQMEAGAVGICTAKVSEAAVMVRAGIECVLITSPISTPYKASAVNSILDPNVTLLLVVDSMEGFAALSAEIDDDKRVGLLLDLDVSMGRTGIRDDLFLRLLDAAHSDDRFYFAGVQHYAGHIMHIPDFEQRRENHCVLGIDLPVSLRCSISKVSGQIL